jgi:haloalkane dehalogenase
MQNRFPMGCSWLSKSLAVVVTACSVACASPTTVDAHGVPSWVDRGLYPFTPHALTTPEGTLRYVDEGPRDASEVLVFIHGTPSWSLEWHDAITTLCTHGTARCIAPDFLGYGLSDKPADGAYEMWDHARRLDALLTSLQLPPATLIVHDVGGPIGLAYAAAHPERIARLVVCNTFLWPLDDDAEIQKGLSLVDSSFGHFLYTQLNASPRYLVPTFLGPTHKLDDVVHAHLLAPFPDASSRQSLWHMGVSMHHASSWLSSLWTARTALADKPVLLVWGTADPAFGTSYLDRFHALWPQAHITSLPASGHFPQLEEPAAVTEALRAFVQNAAP